MALQTYFPEAITIVLGTHSVTGFADGEFVTVERDEDTWSKMTGADGETTRSKNANKAGKVTLRLKQDSASNEYLSATALADEASGAGTQSLMIKNPRGSTLASAATAWVKKPANIAYGKEVGTREWVIETDELIMNVGT